MKTRRLKNYAWLTAGQAKAEGKSKVRKARLATLCVSNGRGNASRWGEDHGQLRQQ